MSDSAPALFTAPTVFTLPFAGLIHRDIAYGEGERRLDLYLPENLSAPAPVVIIVPGYPEAGFRAAVGLGLRELGQYQSWARLIAASGMAALTCSTVNPAADIALVVDFIQRQGESLGLDAKRIGLWSCSGNVPNAIAVLQKIPTLRCAALLYGYMLDLHGGAEVADAARQYRFANTADPDCFLPDQVPLLVLRAGKDRFADILRSIDGFVAEALQRNHPLFLLNHATGGHNFDLLEYGPASNIQIQTVLGFLRDNLR